MSRLILDESKAKLKEADTIEVTPTEIKTSEEAAEITPEAITAPASTPVDEEQIKIAVSNIINAWIQDEFQAIQGYEGGISTIMSLATTPGLSAELKDALDKITEIAKDINPEESVHIGQLQVGLSLINADSTQVEKGKQEATDSLGGEEVVDNDDKKEEETEVKDDAEIEKE